MRCAACGVPQRIVAASVERSAAKKSSKEFIYICLVGDLRQDTTEPSTYACLQQHKQNSCKHILIYVAVSSLVCLFVRVGVCTCECQSTHTLRRTSAPGELMMLKA